MNTANERQRVHYTAREMIVEGHLHQAIQTIETAIDSLGPHVGLQCELAGCYYELGRFQECWALVRKIDTDFENYEGRLSRESKRRTCLMLAKFFEEMLEPAKALEKLGQAHDVSDSFTDRLSIYSNELRLLAYFGVKQDLQTKYAALHELTGSDSNLTIEVLHGLMWAESSLFGLLHASARFRQMMALDLNSIDRRLIHRDFLEISLLSTTATNPTTVSPIDIASALRCLEPLPFDLALIEFVASPRPADKVRRDLHYSDMMRLRLLLIELHRTSNFERARELNKLYRFLVDDVSAPSRRLLLKILPETAVEETIEFNVVTDSRRLQCKKHEMDVRVTAHQLIFCSLFESESYRTLDQVAEALWNCESSPSIYHRVRMMTYKLNAAVEGSLGLKPFDVTKHGVKLHGGLKLRKI